MTVWLLMKMNGSNYCVYKNKPIAEKIEKYFYYGHKTAIEHARDVVSGKTVMGWYLVEEDVYD